MDNGKASSAKDNGKKLSQKQRIKQSKARKAASRNESDEEDATAFGELPESPT